MADEKIVRGFYYEAELSNKYIAATLHANTYPEIDENSNIVFKEAPKSTQNNLVDVEGYFVNPICSAIMPEDFVFEVMNSFNPVGSDPIGLAWSSTVPTVSAYYSKGFKEKVDKILDKLGDIENIADKKLNDFLIDKFGQDNKIVDAKGKAEKVLGDLKDTLLGGEGAPNIHSALSVQGTSYKSYSGSTITVGNGGLVMRFTIFSEFKNIAKKGQPAEYRFIPCTWEVNRLLPYVLGEWEPLKDTETLEYVKEHLGISESFINWQRPPAGFESTYKNIDTLNKGTLKLRLGNFYYMDNLVIQQGSFNFSKVMAKIPFLNGYQDREINSTLSGGRYNELAKEYLIKKAGDLDYKTYCPYSCDVALSLVPVSNYSRDKLINFMQGYGSPDEQVLLAEKQESVYDDNIQSSEDVVNSGIGI